MEPIRLTQTVQKGGCAAKIPAIELRRILQNIEFPPAHEALLVDGRYFDDAAIYKVTDDVALVQTIDFFTPIIDTPRAFGAVAACNALSDVYAMGGRPKTAMGVLAFPLASLPEEVIREVMQGAADMVKQAQANFVGGHSIDDDSLKFGLSVTGFVNPGKIWSNQGAKPGDHIILTKPLGTGTMTAALKRGAVSEDEISEAITSMSRLNNIVDFMPEPLLQSINAATDITGFGLSGHAVQVARASNVTMKMNKSSIPTFTPVHSLLKDGFLTKAHRTNKEYTAGELSTAGLDEVEQLIIHDPQTSGGLLLSVNPSTSGGIINLLAPYFPGIAVIGEVIEPQNHRIIFHS